MRFRILLLLFFGALSQAVFAMSSTPNVVIILADDLGWNDVGYHGSEIRTPTLDKLASQSVVLNQYHSQPTCSPTRAALMTGKSPQRLGVYRQFSKNATHGLPLEERTMADRLKGTGYQTWLVGKWHLGFSRWAYHPNARGFDHFYGHVTGGIGYWDHVHGGGFDWQRNGVTVREDGYSTHLLAEEAVRLIQERDWGKSFFLYASFNAPHLPNEAPGETIDSYSDITNPYRRVHAAMVTELDRAVKKIIDELDRQGELENTLIWFMSDNGGLNRESMEGTPFVRLSEVLEDWFGAPLPLQMLEFVRTNALEGGSDNSPLRYGKSSVYEGGSRVPSFVYFPAELAPTRNDAFITVQDVLPTILSMVSADVPNDLDGRNQRDVLAGQVDSAATDYVIRGQFDDQAYYQWPWKLVIDGEQQELYHLVDDPLETNNLAAIHPERVADMRQLLDSIPRAQSVHIPTYKMLMDPDFFGGEEDREPWAEITER